MVTEGLLLLLVVFVWLYWLICKNFGKWEQLGVPCIPGRFPYGSNSELLTRSTHHNTVTLREYSTFKDKDFYGTYKFGKPVLHIKNPDLVGEVLVKNFKNFTDRFDSKICKLMDGGDLDQYWFRQMAMMSGEEWRDVRSTFTPIFTSGKMKAMYRFMKGVSNELVEELDKIADTKQDFDLKEFFGKYSLDSLANCAFGINPHSFKQQDSVFVKNAKAMFSQTPMSMLILFSRLIPGVLKLHKLLNINALHPRETKFFKDTITRTINHRKETGHRENDLIDMMLDCLKEDNRTNKDNETDNRTDKDNRRSKQLDENIIVATALVLLVAGYDTTGITLSFLVYELAKNPQVQETLQQEVDDVYERHGGLFPDYEEIQSLPYLEMCLLETLRLHPPLGDLLRSCTQDCKIEGIPGTIKKNDLLSIPVIGIHLDQTIYPDPEKFNPENFSKEARQSRSQYTFLGFGQGPRACIGMRFALLEAKVCMVEIIRKFNILNSPSNPDNLVLDPKGALGFVKDGLFARLSRRK